MQSVIVQSAGCVGLLLHSGGDPRYCPTISEHGQMNAVMIALQLDTKDVIRTFVSDLMLEFVSNLIACIYCDYVLCVSSEVV